MVLGSLSVLLGTLGDMQGSPAHHDCPLLVLAILVALAVAASRNGRPVVAGLCGFVAVAVVAVVAGSLLDAVGVAGDVSLFDQGLIQVVNEIAGVFEPDVESHQPVLVGRPVSAPQVE